MDCGVRDVAALRQLVISQVYVGGGRTNAPFANDFIELFNQGHSTVALDSIALRYASAASTNWINQIMLGGSVPPGGFFLVKLGGEGMGGGVLPTPNASNAGINLSVSAGKVALTVASYTTATACPSAMLSMVGYGSAATCSQGTHAPASSTQALLRTNLCTNAQDNSTDFSLGPPNPRNDSSTVIPCP
jgi:predicted extracellular nuclease